ncbi:MAG TPA: orotidine-5'-phosphate decarboxylase [Bacteroidales bacterium]|nr:orotidine-5'-phosphate decarboxylase [Bacteroidales bacterium]HRX98040.1 orotidine-5'-phosphate decarboxylase [Bacteroidales bacterium]
MTKKELFKLIQQKRSFLCIGLDTDLKKIPQHLLNEEDPIFAFNKAIIDATHDITLAYKPNIAFYESLGAKGWISLEKTINYLSQFNVFTIADAKRGDIGNTSALYARAFFENLSFDAVTVAPYMGSDSVSPFLGYENKWVILLALTSNKGAFDFQLIKNKETNRQLFEEVLETSGNWGNSENMMYVVGATKAEMLADIRKIIPDHFLLVPGVGAQGGSLDEVVKYGMNETCGLIVNSSRGIIYASGESDFAETARQNALELQQQMEQHLMDHKIV